MKKISAQSLIQGNHSLEFFEGGQYVFTTRTADGGRAYKFISPAIVAAAFRDAPVDSGWTAPGLVRCGTSTKGEFAVSFIAAQRHTLLVEMAKTKEAVPMQIYLPSLVFVGIGKHYSVWAMSSPTLQPDALLFHAPLPNVFYNGGICWGENRPAMANATNINKGWELFITSPFNGHVANGKSVSETEDVRILLKQLADSKVDHFPLGELIATETTLNQRISPMIGTTE